jgi:hypothetical protein
MSITASIRKRPWLLLGMIIIALLAFLINPESMDKMFGQNPNILGKVNGEEITRDEFNDQLSLLQQQSQGQPQQGLEEQAWQILDSFSGAKAQLADGTLMAVGATSDCTERDRNHPYLPTRRFPLHRPKDSWYQGGVHPPCP